MIPFEIKQYFDSDNNFAKGIFIDGELFDWGINEENFKDAIAMGPEYFRLLQADIEHHFLDSISEFMGRRVTQQEINEATTSGWIKK